MYKICLEVSKMSAEEV